jgi:hypothetical protein
VWRAGAGWREALWLVLCVGASSAWCVTASARLGATFDEPTYVRLGLESWRSGTARRLLDLGTMPLPSRVQTLPLYVWERWRGQPFDVDRDLGRLLRVARLGTLPFWWLLLVYGWRAGRSLGGPAGGRLAVAFLACEPNLLAHATLATTDTALAACLMALLFQFRTGRDGPWAERVGAPAAWFGLAVLAKASGLVFGLLGLVVIEAGRRAGAAAGVRPRLRAAAGTLSERAIRRDLAQIGAIGLAVSFVYCGTDWDVSPSFVAWARQLDGGPTGVAMVWLAEHLRVFSNAGVALARQVRHNVQGHGAFLLGQVAPRAIWYYFPAALTVKAPTALLLLPLALAWLRPRSLVNWACGVTVAMLAFSLVCRVQTGIRLVLPVLVLVAVGLAAAAARAGAGRRRPATAVALACAGWMAWSSASAWPHGLCFVNELWGGSAGGYRLLSDSNYDWGQGLKELARWQGRHQVADLTVFYYGTDTALSRLRMRRLEWSLPAPDLGGAAPAELRGRTLAVSTSILFGSVSDWPMVRRWVTYLRSLQPADRTTTFLIYRFPGAGSAPGAQVAARGRP